MASRGPSPSWPAGSEELCCGAMSAFSMDRGMFGVFAFPFPGCQAVENTPAPRRRDQRCASCGVRWPRARCPPRALAEVMAVRRPTSIRRPGKASSWCPCCWIAGAGESQQLDAGLPRDHRAGSRRRRVPDAIGIFHQCCAGQDRASRYREAPRQARNADVSQAVERQIRKAVGSGKQTDVKRGRR